MIAVKKATEIRKKLEKFHKVCMSYKTSHPLNHAAFLQWVSKETLPVVKQSLAGDPVCYNQNQALLDS